MKHPGRAPVHGMRNTPEYDAWRSMKKRCHLPTSHNYALYGARGISVCARWRESFEAFYADMGARPAGTSLDRIDNDGDYAPENCRWATNKQQARNKCTNVHVTAFGETKTITEWAEDPRCRVTMAAFWKRLEAGWSSESAITTPKMNRGPAPKRNHQQTLAI